MNEAPDQSKLVSHADEMEVDHRPLTFQPFAKLADLGKCVSLERVEHSESHIGTEADWVAGDSAPGISDALRYPGRKSDTAANPSSDLER